MTAPDVITRPTPQLAWRNIPRTALVLAAGLLMLGAVFRQEIVAAIGVWSSSTAYNHCFLVLPIALYLAWDRRAALHDLVAKPVPAVALAGIPVAVIWLIAERLGIMEGRQLAAMTFVELLFLSVLGWQFFWAFSGPLLYLYFLVPFGATITPQLQGFTTAFVHVGLNLLHIPVFINGYTIEIPQGAFYIAEACAGLRFLIASLAFGSLYALVMYRTPVRRTLFMLASLIVPVIANGLRALGIVVLGNLLGSAKAAATDHVFYGWLFFSTVILILIALGLPFREDLQTAQPVTHGSAPSRPLDPRSKRLGAFAAIAVCLIALLSPTIALALEPGAAPPPAPLSAIDFGPRCSLVARPGDTASANTTEATRQLRCGGLTVLVRMRMLSPRVTAGPFFRVERDMIARVNTEEGYQSMWVQAAPGRRRTWRLLKSRNPVRIMAVASWADGKPVTPGLRERFHMAWTSIFGAVMPPVVITATPDVDWTTLGREQRHDMMQHFIQILQSWPNMTAELRRTIGHS